MILTHLQSADAKATADRKTPNLKKSIGTVVVTLNDPTALYAFMGIQCRLCWEALQDDTRLIDLFVPSGKSLSVPQTY